MSLMGPGIRGMSVKKPANMEAAIKPIRQSSAQRVLASAFLFVDPKAQTIVDADFGS
jgi:hypothetical protein